MSAIPQESAGKKSDSNIVKVILRPENRLILIGVLALIILLVMGIAVSIYKMNQSTAPTLVTSKGSVKAAPQNVMTGKESALYKKEVENYNASTFYDEAGEKDENGNPVNPSLHPIAVDMSVDEKECALDDTSCMRAEGMIGPDDCAPDDFSCGIPDDDCNSADTACMRSKGLIKPDDCAPDDYACLHAKIEAPASSGPSVYGEEYMNQLRQELATIQTKPNFQMGDYKTPDEQNGQPVATSSLSGTNPPNPASTGAKTVLVEAMTLDYAISELALSSDYQGPVWLTIAGGPRDGAQLLGDMELVSERLRLTLHTMKTTDGSVYPINAIVLDPTTSYAVYEGEVDRHLLYRYGFWGLGTVLKAAGDVTRLGGTTLVVNDGVSQSGTNLDTTDKILVGAGELGSDLGQQFKDRLNRPVEVKVPAGAEMAVFFQKDVFE